MNMVPFVYTPHCVKHYNLIGTGQQYGARAGYLQIGLIGPQAESRDTPFLTKKNETEE